MIVERTFLGEWAFFISMILDKQYVVFLFFAIYLMLIVNNAALVDIDSSARKLSSIGFLA